MWPILFPAAPSNLFQPDSAFAPCSSTQSNYLAEWISFLRTEKKGRSISKDVWTLFLDFTTDIDTNFEKYDIDAAWPSVIDEFVEYAKAKLERGEALGGDDEEADKDPEAMES